MTVDYSPFTNTLENGSIWWRLEDAVKLGDGYLPVRDDQKSLTTELRAESNQARVNERTLLAEFSQHHDIQSGLRLISREDGRYLEAGDFLNWLSQYISNIRTDISFPSSLAKAVREAYVNSVSSHGAEFESLTNALQDNFSLKLSDLAPQARQRDDKDFFPMPWDALSEELRRMVAAPWDYQHDPAMEVDRQHWWDFYIGKDELEIQIHEWANVSCPTAGELDLKKRLAQIKDELLNMEKKEAQLKIMSVNQQKQEASKRAENKLRTEAKPEYIAYPKAMKLLADRLQATPEELAIWLFFEDNGLEAYTNANELYPPPRFYYAYFAGSGGFDYVKPPMACWFNADDIAKFQPSDRYVMGKQLIERWGKYPAIQPKAFIEAKIRESRLIDAHPIYGFTQGTDSERSDIPPIETALFCLAHIEEVEGADFGEVGGVDDSVKPRKAQGHLNFDPNLQKRANEIATEFIAAKNRSPTKSEVARILAPKVNLTPESTARRIRVKWRTT